MAEQRFTDAQIQGLLQTLAAADPDFAPFAEQHASLGQHRLPGDEAAALARDLFAALRESPEQAAQVDALLRSPAIGRFEGGLVTVPVLLGATFLLRTHIRFKRRADGKWEFQIEHTPAHGMLLTQALNKLTALVRIPRQSGRGFRFDVGHRSDLI